MKFSVKFLIEKIGETQAYSLDGAKAYDDIIKAVAQTIQFEDIDELENNELLTTVRKINELANSTIKKIVQFSNRQTVIAIEANNKELLLIQIDDFESFRVDALNTKSDLNKRKFESLEQLCCFIENIKK